MFKESKRGKKKILTDLNMDGKEFMADGEALGCLSLRAPELSLMAWLKSLFYNKTIVGN